MITLNPNIDIDKETLDFINKAFETYYKRVPFAVATRVPDSSVFVPVYTPQRVPEYNQNIHDYEGKKGKILATDSVFCFVDFESIERTDPIGNIFALNELSAVI